MRRITPILPGAVCIVFVVCALAAAANWPTTRVETGDLTGPAIETREQPMDHSSRTAGERGDVNLNSIAYEIGDAVLFSRFLIEGQSALHETLFEEQLDASDTDCDDMRATTHDLMYMVRVITDTFPLCDSWTPPAREGPIPSAVDTMRILGATGRPGDTVTVELYLANVDTVGAFACRLTYNPSVIEPLTDTTVLLDTLITVEAEQLRGEHFEFFGASVPRPGVVLLAASEFNMEWDNLFFPGSGAVVRMPWRILPGATPQIASIFFETDVTYPQSWNTISDVIKDYWTYVFKRPVLDDGTIVVQGEICECPHQGDYDEDGFITVNDLHSLIGVLFGGSLPMQDPDCPIPRGDLDCDGFQSASDLAYMIDHLFGGGPGPCDPCAPGEPSGEVIGWTDCKSFGRFAPEIDVPPDQDCIEYSYDGVSVLSFKHINAGFNCCPDSFSVDVYVGFGNIAVDEIEWLSNPCACLCLFDFDYQIIGLSPGIYTVRINEPYVYEQQEVLEFTVDLTAATSGIHCVYRDEYPWGIW